MSDKQTGGPAFPIGTTYQGMTLRDYFAAKAMQAMLCAPYFETSKADNIPNASYVIADAMLKARQ